MAALDYFEGIVRARERIANIQQQLALLESRLEPHGQQLGATGHGGNADRMFNLVLVRMQLTELQELESTLPHLQAKLDARVSHALNVLYGRSGRGGLAKSRSTEDADIICCHYLQGMGWAEIAREVVKPDTSWPSQWCKQRAERALAWIDRVGMDELADS